MIIKYQLFNMISTISFNNYDEYEKWHINMCETYLSNFKEISCY